MSMCRCMRDCTHEWCGCDQHAAVEVLVEGCETDRDLIAACRARLAAAGENPATDSLFDYAVWAVETMPLLLDALEAARATNQRLNLRCQKAEHAAADQLKMHEGKLGSLGRGMANWAAAKYLAERDEARAELEAAQRPLLGHLVMAKRDTGASSVGPVWSDEVKAVGHLARISDDGEKHPGIWHGAVFVLAEVREVTGDA